VLKEIMDNGLDACEEAEIAPVISVKVNPDSGTIIIQDNADGIETDTVTSILDYTIRVSSREAYVSPTRGAQGNALKTILAMGYVLDREDAGNDADAVGVTIIETRGVKHHIKFEVDHINLQPRITHDTTSSSINVGTKITVKWPPNPQLWDWYNEDKFKELAESYTWFNPHLTLRGFWNREQFINVEATNPNWEKWRPRNPTSPRWYDLSRMTRYLAAHVARDRDLGRHRTVREFIGEFRGLSRTAVQRKVLQEVGCSHQSLAQFYGVEKVNRKGIAVLLASMQKHSKPVTPKHLGIIGAEHFNKRFLAAGGNADTFRYERRMCTTDEGIPCIIECAFGIHQSGLTQDDNAESGRFIAGANWSVGINNPFRTFGSTGEGLENELAELRANAKEPVICAMHLASAHIQYADRGKSSIILNEEVDQSDDD
jgi:DNA topoisomerase VI subunit B